MGSDGGGGYYVASGGEGCDDGAIEGDGDDDGDDAEDASSEARHPKIAPGSRLWCFRRVATPPPD